MKCSKLKGKLTVGVFSSSSPISAAVPVRYERGKEYLRSKGIDVIDGNLCGKQDFYRSGSIRERAAEFNQLLYNDEIQVLMASIGGNNTNSVLPYIDYEYLRHHPKVIVGYSDTTALLLGIYAKTGLVTFYGPALAASFGEFPPFVDWTYENFINVILGYIEIPYEYKMPSVWTDEFISWSQQDRGKTEYENSWVCVNPGICTGRLIGGNLNTMEGSFNPPTQVGPFTPPGITTPPVTPKTDYKSFYLSTEVDLFRFSRDMQKIYDEVLDKLQAIPNAKLKVSLEVEADFKSGTVDVNTKRSVEENCRALGLGDFGFNE